MSEIRIRIQCVLDVNHAKILRLDAAKGAAYARDLAELVCGTSKMYIFPPGDKSPIFRCSICGGLLTASYEELGTPEAWEFDGYRLRATIASDLGLAAEWTAADAAHAGLDPMFWLEQGPSKQSYLLFDDEGPVFFFKGILAMVAHLGGTQILEVYIQFPPFATAAHEVHAYKTRIARALAGGTEWLAGRMRGVVDEFVFETSSPSLKHFCERRLDFEMRDGRLRKRIGVPVMG
jgi:hypothetical protein